MGSPSPNYHKYMQLILIIHRYHICEFTYLLKFICNVTINIINYAPHKNIGVHDLCVQWWFHKIIL
jgi:hypothetical protein